MQDVSVIRMQNQVYYRPGQYRQGLMKVKPGSKPAYSTKGVMYIVFCNILNTHLKHRELRSIKGASLECKK